MQLAFYFDQTRCTGCYTCTVACKDWHDVPAGPASWRRVSTIEKGRYPRLFVAFLSEGCYHCEEPLCVTACPAGAISKRVNDGIVVVDRDQCLGAGNCSRKCLDACPYKAPQFGAEDNPKMQKCDFCLERWAENKPPICVAACPTRALDAGSLEDMQLKHSQIKEAIGFTYREDAKPAVVFKPKLEVYPDVMIL